MRVEILLAASIAAMLIMFPFSEAISSQLFFVVCFFALVLFDSSLTRIRSRLILLMLLLLAVATVVASAACSLGGFYGSTWYFLQRYVYPVAVFLILANAQLRYLTDKIVAAVMIGGLVVGVCAAAPGAVYVSRTTFTPLHFPGIPALNHSAAYVCFAMTGLLIAASRLRRQPLPILFYTLGAAFVLVGFLTRSRSFLLGVVSVVGGNLFLLRGNRAPLREALLGVAGLAAAAIVAMLTFSDALTRMLRNLFGDFFHGRLEIWSDALTLFSRYPACGIGLGRFRDEAFNPVYVERASGEFYQHGHNIFLNSLAEGGLLLFVAVAAVIFAGAVFVVSELRANPESPLVRLQLMISGVFLLVGMLDDTIVPMLALVPAIALGFLYSFRASNA